MLKKIIILLIIFIFNALSLHADILFDLEGGAFFNTTNDVRIPGGSGTLFSGVDDLDAKIKPYMRFTISGRINNKHNISALISLLYAKSEGLLKKDVYYNNVFFSKGLDTTFNFKFNNYRLTYRYDFFSDQNFRFGAGLTFFIRDAYIELENQINKTKYSNIGFVPLINLKLEWFFISSFGLYFETDFMITKRGRAEDISVAFLYNIDNFTFRLGYRLIEGGADNDKVYNFALFHFIYFAINLKLNI